MCALDAAILHAVVDMTEKCVVRGTSTSNVWGARRMHAVHASWLAGARAGDFQPVTLLSNVVNHARAAFSL